jgi:hypothetical protein
VLGNAGINKGEKMIKVLFSTLCAVGILWAGQNSLAKLYIDTDVSTSKVDSVKMCVRDSTFTVGVNITNAVEVYGFQVYLQFDTSRLQYLSAVQGNASSPNILESKGGSIFFNKKISKDDSTRILLAGSLLGDDKTQCAVGSGFLALVTFKMKVTDTTKLMLVNPSFLDYNGVEDTNLQMHPARIVPGLSDIVFTKNSQKSTQKINQVNRKIHLSLSDMSRSEISLIDLHGRILTKRTEQSQQISLDFTNRSAGFYILKIAQNGVINTYSLFFK